MSNKNTLQTLGILLVIFGVLLILVALPSTTMIHGCPPFRSTPCIYNTPMYWSGFILGVALVVIGIVLLLAARKMKPEEDMDR